MNDYIDSIIDHMQVRPNQTLAEEVYLAMRQAIIQGHIMEGQRINEKELSSRAHISRTPIREALHRLTEEKLISYVPHVGAVVTRITPADVAEIFEIRIVLDRLATFHAMQNMQAADFDALDQLLTETEAANQESDIPTVIHGFEAFNNFIYQQSQMPHLILIVSRLRDYLKHLRDVSLNGQERRNKALQEHREIYELMREQNRPELGRILAEHLTYSKTFILSEMAQGQQHAN
ncbi:GntR family transcriptional regulator [Lactobacillus sp. CC-MHH1034]|uniref:GntR family transcriptional regulator n=1 Tax=Agrilactobacillus fermenti TaxID=2586909 RepID=UPI001E356174|nr:GntR family transcriptional regulator [Agrilactobacillus fermenti]MCD2256101.1 GntR family transcriptional regulator [Agrilactobacillus fermenti]